MFLGFEIWRQLVVKEEERKSLEEIVPDVWSNVWNQGGQGGASLGVSSWGGACVSELRRAGLITGRKAWQW